MFKMAVILHGLSSSVTGCYLVNMIRNKLSLRSGVNLQQVGAPTSRDLTHPFKLCADSASSPEERDKSRTNRADSVRERKAGADRSWILSAPIFK